MSRRNRTTDPDQRSALLRKLSFSCGDSAWRTTDTYRISIHKYKRCSLEQQRHAFTLSRWVFGTVTPLDLTASRHQNWRRGENASSLVPENQNRTGVAKGLPWFLL